jgi:4'-phosphopantetheinyl transferase
MGLETLLSSDERQRAVRFRFERDRSRFIVSRGTLRSILASYLGDKPDAIRFCYETNGKPKLQRPFYDSGIRFNLSHSEGLALYAFTRGRDVGVDVEYQREISEMELVVEQFFSESERGYFARLPEHMKQEAFFSCWTRKEAYLKASGEGMSNLVDMLDVMPGDGLSSGPSDLPGDTEKWSEWSIRDIMPAEGYAGAVVAQGSGWNLGCVQWPVPPGDRPECIKSMQAQIHSSCNN